MRKMFFGLLIVAAAALSSSAVYASNCDLGGGYYNGCSTGGCGDSGCAARFGNGYKLFALNDCPGATVQVGKTVFEVGGWMEAGIYGNEYGARAGNSAPFGNPDGQWGGNSTGIGNGAALGSLRNGDFNMQQMGFFIEKKMDTRCGWDWGTRMEAVYGTDAWIAQSWGDGPDKKGDFGWGEGDYGLALPQMYGEVGYHKWSIKAGRFASPFALDPYAATERFFYSRSLAFNLDPVVGMTGALVNYDVNKCFSVFGGWTAGFDTLVNENDGSTGIFGARAKLGRTALGYTAGIGTLADLGAGGADVFRQSFSFDWYINRCWQYSLAYNMVNYSEFPGAGNAGGYGISNELLYKYNRCWAFGLRGEWYKNTGVEPNNWTTPEGTNNYELTLGANWTPAKRLTIRPELRYDWCDENRFGKAGDKDTQVSGGCAAIVKF
ncbi:MAG: outer membrane beta-barrel protein [Thermoguttaceae bacterium]